MNRWKDRRYIDQRGSGKALKPTPYYWVVRPYLITGSLNNVIVDS